MKQALTKAHDRFWAWIMPIGITRYNYPTKAAIYRYPAPSNIPIVEPLEDYRLPYGTSKYNIRYKHETYHQREPYGSYYSRDPVHPTTIEEKYIYSFTQTHRLRLFEGGTANQQGARRPS